MNTRPSLFALDGPEPHAEMRYAETRMAVDPTRESAAPDAASAQAGLVLLYAPAGAALPPAFLLVGREVRVGRGDDNDLVVPDASVSRLHARLVGAASTWAIVDENSRNGTVVAGKRIRERALAHLEVVRLGDVFFAFVARDAGIHVADRPPNASPLVGGAVVSAIVREIERIAQTSLSCLVVGPSGSGKTTAGVLVHQRSGRVGPFHAVTAAEIPDDPRTMLEAARGGTLFLEELLDLPLEVQAKLLRALQSKELASRAGRDGLDARLVGASSGDVYAAVRSGRFRAELFARFNDHVVRLPPLRERKEDIRALVQAFAARHGKPALAPTVAAMAALLEHDWPFDVRELESCVARAVRLVDDDTLDVVHLPEAVRARSPSLGDEGEVADGAPLDRAPTEPELRALVVRHRGNVSAIARAVGKERMQIHRWLKRHGIDPELYRDGGD